MVDPDLKPTSKLSLHVEKPQTQEIALAQEMGMITEIQQQQLTVATDDARSLILSAAFVQGPDPLKRHASFVDSMMAISPDGPSAITKARDCLSTINNTWEEIRPEFHKYKRLYYEAKKKRIEAKQLLKKMEEATDADEKELFEADYFVMLAEAEEMESECAYGQRAIKEAMDISTEASEKYALILKESGKKSFSKSDFEREELEYFLMAAWWHASNTFTVYASNPSAKKRISDGVKNAHQQGKNPADIKITDYVNIDKDTKVLLNEDAFQFMVSLGIPRATAENEVKGLMSQKQAFGMINQDQPQDFSERHTGWLRTMTNKYIESALSQVSVVGYSRIRQIGSALAQSFENKGPPDQLDWDGVTR